MALKRISTLLAAASTIALLAGCESAPSWFNEAGAQITEPSFGDATRNNTGIQSGELQYVINLAGRFSAEVTDTVNFAFNSAQIDAAARATLVQQANWIKQFPEVRFKVYGHTDLVGSASYNRRLGLRRARAVVSFLVSQGISRSRLEAVVSQGESQPLVVTQGRERRNRRTVTEVTGFVRSHPLILDGKYAQIVYREYVASAIPASSLSSSLGQEN